MGPLLGLERTSDSRPANYSLLIIENTGPNTGADDADLKRQGPPVDRTLAFYYNKTYRAAI
jgi:hypothetical protein